MRRKVDRERETQHSLQMDNVLTQNEPNLT